MIFQEKCFPLMLYSAKWPNFIIWLPLLLDILGNTCIATACFWGCDKINFETNFSFLFKPFLHDQKFKTKTKIFLERKELLIEIKSIFIILKGFQSSKIVSDVRVCLSKFLNLKHWWKNLVTGNHIDCHSLMVVKLKKHLQKYIYIYIYIYIYLKKICIFSSSYLHPPFIWSNISMFAGNWLV